MPDDADLDPLLLDQYLAGDLPDAEMHRVERWLAAHPELTAFLHVAERAAARAPGGLPSTDASWRQLATRISTDAEVDDLTRRRLDAEGRTPVSPPRRRWSHPAIRVAAAIVILLGGAAVWRTVVHDAGGALEAPLGREVSATLPDGSRLTLAAGSRVRWPAGFGTAARDLELEGEAYFDVVHDTARPFRVRSRDAVAEDIGTRFVVRAWPELAQVEVAVDEGVVALRDTVAAHAALGATLRAGDRGRLTPDGLVTVTPDADVVTAWTRGQLVFDNEPLAVALPAIGRRFAVDLRADTSLASRRLSARLPSTNVDAVLDALALALDARVVTTGRTITLSPSSR